MSKASEIENLVDRINDFPTLPTIYTKLMKTMSDPNSTVEDVAEIISKDQATTAKILKITNSPVFAIRNDIETISDAIFFIGFNEVKNLVLTLSVMNMFDDLKSVGVNHILNLWKHSIAVGVVTRVLGNELGIKNIENYLLSGILHDIGKLVLFKILQDKYIEMIDESRNEGIFLNDIEKKYLGIDHSMIGGMLIKKWKLPQSIKLACEYHHTGYDGKKKDTQIACVHLANIISQLMEIGTTGNPVIDKPNFKIWEILDFKENSLSDLYDTFKLNYEQSARILSIN